MSRIRLFIVVLLGVMYVSNSIVLSWLYPNAGSDYYQFVRMIAERAKVYEFMFTGFFLVIFLNAERKVKAWSCFFMILTCGSFIDKTIFNITTYLYSDILLIAIASLTSYYVYVRENQSPAQ